MKGLFFFLFTCAYGTKLIQNGHLPACRNCVHFSHQKYYGSCRKFGEKNIVTEEISYDIAESCRYDETRCGMEGRFFQQETPLKIQLKWIEYPPVMFCLVQLSVFTITLGWTLRSSLP